MFRIQIDKDVVIQRILTRRSGIGLRPSQVARLEFSRLYAPLHVIHSKCVPISQGAQQSGLACGSCDRRIRGRFLSKAENNAPIYLAPLEPAEDLVDGF